VSIEYVNVKYNITAGGTVSWPVNLVIFIARSLVRFLIMHDFVPYYFHCVVFLLLCKHMRLAYVINSYLLIYLLTNHISCLEILALFTWRRIIQRKGPVFAEVI